MGAVKKSPFSTRRRGDAYYTLWTRKKGTKKWIHSGTPDSNHAEERIYEWAEANPSFEYKLERECRINESVIISA